MKRIDDGSLEKIVKRVWSILHRLCWGKIFVAQLFVYFEKRWLFKNSKCIVGYRSLFWETLERKIGGKYLVRGLEKRSSSNPEFLIVKLGDFHHEG